MLEIKEKRNLNSKHFLLSSTENVMHAHAGHIHYDDKLDSKRFREIDWTLNFDEAKRGWYFNYHSFRPFLPEYADEWVEFRDLFDDKDQTVKYKAVAAHVKGRLVTPEDIGLKDTAVNCVIYDNAFGMGFDYILYFTRSTLKKVVRIRDGYKPNEDVNFDFEVELPEKKKFRTQSKEMLSDGYEFIGDTDKTFNTAKQLIIGDDKQDGREWFTYLRDFKCWDEIKAESIVVDYFIEDGKKYLRKNITKEFLDNSIGDVFTDTTTSYYAGAGDGDMEVGNTGATWSTIVNTTTASNARYTNAYLQLSYNANNSVTDRWDNMRRVGFPFDTSGLGDVTVQSATINIWAYSKGNPNSNSISTNIVQFSPASNTSIVTGDWNEFGTTQLATAITQLDWNEGSYTTFTLNSSGLSNINTSGYSVFGLKWLEDITNTEPDWYDDENVFCNLRASEQTGTANDPYISITYTEEGADNALAFGVNF